MLGAGSLENVAVHSGLNATHGVPQRISTSYVLLIHCRVFRSESPPRRTLRPQKVHTFSENCNPGQFPRRSGGCCRNETTKEFHELNWIRRAIDHERRERIGSIERNVSPLLNSSTNIRTTSLQSRKKTVPVGLGGDSNYCVPCLERSTDEPGNFIQ